jgi:hypothetical protein
LNSERLQILVVLLETVPDAVVPKLGVATIARALGAVTRQIRLPQM